MPSELDAKLQKRKLDALKRGIHRVRGESSDPYAIHLVGLGKAGCDVVNQVLHDVPASYLADERVRLTALAVDIGNQDFSHLRDAATALKSDRVQVETIALDVPKKDELWDSMQRHRDFLMLEYPLYYANPDYQPWIPNDLDFPAENGHFERAVAKAIYSRAYYDGSRPLAKALRRFRKSVDSTDLDSIVCIVYSLAGGTGSGIAVDLARHLSTIEFGHRVVVVGIGIAPCEGDQRGTSLGKLFPVLSELDCMLDESNNRGVTAAFGDLYRNPFTGGFIVVPQQPAWHATKNLELTHKRVDRELSSLILEDHGAQIWETLRFLNWVAAPSTQHSAARTPYGPQWLHLWNFIEAGPKSSAPEWLRQLGVRSSYQAEIIELRTTNPDDADAQSVATSIDQFFKPEANTLKSKGGSPGSAQFILPRLRKTDLDLFFAAQAAYDALSVRQKLLSHSWLMDLGIVLCEPGTHLQGMAGAGLWNNKSWVAVPYDAIRIPEEQRKAAA